jgi:carbon-monoxide dehydrogenase iron sulfur subunit
MREILKVDIRKCMACKACEIECAVAHSQSKRLTEALAEAVRPAPRVQVVAAGNHAVALQCQHCEDAPCIAVCPSGALAKDEAGAVILDGDRCVGCKACVVVCPFGSITVTRRGDLAKCDLCLERRGVGRAPACIVACPTRAIRLVPAEEVATERRRAAAVRLVATATAEEE